MATIHGNKVFLSFVYGEPVISNKGIVWERLSRISTTRFGPWFMTGDFNDIDGHHEKTGGRRRPERSFLEIRLIWESYDMFDFPHIGNYFSWFGRRGRKVIRCRLDRAMGNEEWYDMFSHTRMEYLPFRGSDHRPVLTFLSNKRLTSTKKFRFDKRWLAKPNFETIVRDGWGAGQDGSMTSVGERIAKCRASISQ